MKSRPTDLAQYELLHGQTEYSYDFPTAPTCELLIDIFADRPVSVFLHVCKEGVDKWVPVVSGERRVDFRGRFANCVGARIHCAKECTLNCLVVGHPVGVDPVDYTPSVIHAELPQQTMEDKLRREFAAMLDARLPPRRQERKDLELDAELMGDEIPQAAGAGFEIDDDDPLDPVDGLFPDEPVRDTRADSDRARPNLDSGPGNSREAPAADKPATAPKDAASASGDTA